MTEKNLREQLASLEHDQWAGWMKWLFEHTGTDNPDGSFEIRASSVKRWKRQMNTIYADLSEKEKDSDREEADKVIAIMGEFIHRPLATFAEDWDDPKMDVYDEL